MCIHCGCQITKKNGKLGECQRYKCYGCGKHFIVGNDKIDSTLLWKDYVEGKQTYAQLAVRYKCSVKTIQRRLDKVKVSLLVPQGRAVAVLMDTTYFGRGFGVMLFKDSYTGQNLLKYYVRSETNALYEKGIEILRKNGFTIRAIICEGRKGLLSAFGPVPVQMCQFHQCAIIRRYLTKRPKAEPAKGLKAITALLVHTDKESFTGVLSAWHEQWKYFLAERTVNKKTGKSRYTHRTLRSAYNSLNNKPLSKMIK